MKVSINQRTWVVLDQRLGDVGLHKVFRLDACWRIESIEASDMCGGMRKRSICLCHQDHFICFYAPLASRQLDLHLYQYVVSRLELEPHFKSTMVMDYLLIEQLNSRLVVGMAYDPAWTVSQGVRMVDTTYWSMYRLCLYAHQLRYFVHPILVLCVDQLSVCAFAYGEGLWGYARIITLSETQQSTTEVLANVLQCNPVALQNITAKIYVWSDDPVELIDTLNQAPIAHYCLMNPRDYMVADDVCCDRVGMNLLLLMVGSSLWGKL